MEQRMIRTYSELITIPTHEERFRYLSMEGLVGIETFGSHRYLNQDLYTSNEWREIRREVILRDMGNDLGVNGYEIYGIIYVHHMNPITIEDLLSHNPEVFNPEFLISASKVTHQYIHYGVEELIKPDPMVSRYANDMCPWKV